MRWWFGSMMVVVALAAGACGDDSGAVAGPPTGAQGIWAVVEIDGETVEVGVNTSRVPYFEIEGGEIHGHLGCNEGGGRVAVGDTALRIEDFSTTAAGCLPESGMIAENALSATIRSEVAYSRPSVSTMVWFGGGHEIVLERRAAVPTTTWPERERRHAVQDLDCGDRWVAEVDNLPNDGRTPLDVAAEYVPAVVEVVEIAPLQHVGTDADGTVVVLVFLHDTAEMDFQVSFCED